ncbi:MAG TPA: alpha-hydroxy-acid oxidizing protein, partial [Chryseolinea sp.]|nr:alpha-hydroxy-acid oxidizing protein [Chryseolinea sp.]
MHFSAIDWQKMVYLRGFAGSRPAIPTDSVKLELLAKVRMTAQAFAYVAGGAGSEQTMKANRAAFDECQIIPRMLRNVSERDTRVDLLGMKLPAPVILAPVGVLELVHHEADLAASRAAAALQLPFIFSNQASYPMERCAQGMGDAPRWFQLYWSKSNALVTSLVQRAEKCGCSAIVVTLDTTMLGWRPRDLDLGYLPFLEGKGIAQYTSDPVFQKIMNETDNVVLERRVNLSAIQGLISLVNRYPGKGFFRKLRSGKPLNAVQTFVSTYSNPGTTWDDLKFLRDQTGLKLILKGVLHPDDAKKALDHGVDGIIVSNHGGRQVDGSIATLRALPGIVTAVKGNVPVLLDSGIRGGSDIFKALALGAKAVCVGRPYAYGLAIAGQQGVEDVLR